MTDQKRTERLDRSIDVAKRKLSHIEALILITENPSELQKLEGDRINATTTLRALQSVRDMD